jgi:acetyl esterase
MFGPNQHESGDACVSGNRYDAMMDKSQHPFDAPETITAIVNPEIAEFVARTKTAWSMHPDLASVSVAEARVIAEQVREPWRQGGPRMHRVVEQNVELPSGPIRVRMYYPDDQGMLPALMYMHGGGFTLFSIDTHDRLMRGYAAIGGFVVIAVDYPLSPEAKFPLALNLIVELTTWIAAYGQRWGIDPARLAIGGDSAGGNLALATALRLRDAGKPDLLRGILSNYGAFGRRCSDEAEATFGGPDAVLNREEMEYYWDNYLATPQDADSPYACPLIADTSGLPPTLLAVAEIDILAEDSHILAKRMEMAGTACEVVVYRGATHSFLEAMSVARVAREAIAHAANWLNQRLKAN